MCPAKEFQILVCRYPVLKKVEHNYPLRVVCSNSLPKSAVWKREGKPDKYYISKVLKVQNEKLGRRKFA